MFVAQRIRKKMQRRSGRVGHGLFLSLFLAVFCVPVLAGEQVTVHLFWGKGCPHCEEQIQFLNELERKHPSLRVKMYEVWYDRENASLFARVMKAAGNPSAGVPTTVIGSKIFIGFTESSREGMARAIAACSEQGCADLLQTAGVLDSVHQEEQKPVRIPLMGELDPASISLPLFTVIIGALDSFNPCAFFVLLFLLSMLIHARSRKKMMLIGGTFVFFSGFMYFLFMAAWLNIFLIAGNMAPITVTAAIVALLIGSINIKDFFFFGKGVSLVIPENAKPKLFERMRNLLRSSSLPTLLFGTIVLAVTANAYELMCTAGFPMIYTRALTLHDLSMTQYYLYLVLYNVVYMIPLAVITGVVTFTLGSRKMNKWQGRQLKLLSGIMMFSLGLVLLVRPGFLSNALASIVLLGAAVGIAVIAIGVMKRIRPEITGE